MSLGRALTTVGGLTAVSRLAGFLRDLLTAALLGAGPAADAFFIALRLPDLMRRLLAEGAFSAAFTPQFTALSVREGRAAALGFAEEALALVSAASVVTVALGLWAMPALVALLAPGFADSQAATAAARLTFPYLIPIAVAALMGGVLNGFGRVVAFAAAPIVFNIGMLTALGVVAVFDAPAGTTLAAGVTLAGCLQLAWMTAALRRAGAGLRLRRPRLTPAMRDLCGRLGPGALATGVGQINLTTDLMLASLLPVGAVSALSYADRLAQLPLGLVGLALGMALLPRLAGLSAAGDGAGFADELRRGVLAAAALGLPAAAGLVVVADRIVEVLFVRGAFTVDDARLTAAALAAYAVGIPAAVLAKAQTAALFARGDAKTPLRAVAASAAANLALSLALLPFFGLVGIALATSVAACVNLAWLWAALRRIKVADGVGGAALTAGLAGPTLRIVAATAGMTAVAWGLTTTLPAGAWSLALLLTAAIATYVLLLALLFRPRVRLDRPRWKRS